MAHSDCWRDLEARFRALQRMYDDGLRANWISTAWNDSGAQWYLSGSQDRRVHAVFEWNAERAALELEHAGGPMAIFFWLDLLKRESPNFRTGSSIFSSTADGASHQHESGTIYRLCEASADYCLRLENEGIAAAKVLGSLQPDISVAPEMQVRKPTNERERFVMPILDEKGWSILDWANESNVDFHTANNYLKGKTKTYRATRKKLADGLGVRVEILPK